MSLLAETFYMTLTMTLKVCRFNKIEVVEKLVEWLTFRRNLILAFWENLALTLAILITICINWGRFPHIHFLRSNYVCTNTRKGILFDKGNLPIWSASKHVQSTESLTELLIWPHTSILIWQNTCIFFQNWGIRNSQYHKNLKDIHFVFYIVNQACSLLRLSSVRWWLMK